jgi:amino-acid N-acetyltransferase
METLTTDETQVTFRTARSDDVSAISAMIASEHLPPFFIEDFLDGFIVAELDGTMLACGGVEIYGECAVLRSIVVAPEARGLRLGRRIVELLVKLAIDRGAKDLYLFTMDAWAFWKHVGFADVALDEWREPARACWQYEYISQNRDHEMFAGMHAMWRSA